MKTRDDLPAEAVEAAARAIERFGWPYKAKSRGIARVMLTAALPHLIDGAMVERAILAASRGVEGCDTGQGMCGGTHTDCYYRGILQAALTGETEERHD